MASGVGVSKNAEDVYASLQTKKGNEIPRFITFKMSDDNKEIVVDHIEPRENKSTYADFVNKLKSAQTKDGKDDCRYAVIDYEYEDGGSSNSKIVFIACSSGRRSLTRHGDFYSHIAMQIQMSDPGPSWPSCFCLLGLKIGNLDDNDRKIHSVKDKASGVQVDDECRAKFEDLKLGHKYSYIIYRLSEDLKKIVVDYPLGQLGETYDAFCERLIDAGNNSQGRYAVIDCKYAKDKASKLVFVMWLPDNTVGIKQKMLYTSSKKALRDKLVGIGKEMQCNDTDDLAFSAIVEKCQSKYD